jgi:phage-related protein
MSDLPPIGLTLTADTSKLDAGLKQATRSVNNFSGAAGNSSEAIGKATAKYALFAAGAVKAASAVFSFLKASVEEAQQAKVADARLGAIAQSMGLVTGAYEGATERVIAYSKTLEGQIAVDDDQIKVVQAKLMTFKNLTATVNQTGGAFDRTTKAAYDLAAAGFGSAEQNATQLGKALQDPVKGLTALGRAGVTFTEQEKTQIKSMVEHGEVAKAQNLVLKAIETQVGGTAAATATGTQRMSVAFGDFKETIGNALLDAINRFATTFSTVLNNLKEPISNVVRVLANMAPALLGIAASVGVLYGAYKTLSFGTTVMRALEKATMLAKLEQLKLNLAILANPYVLIGAAIVAALVAMALAFKYVYDHSEQLRKATSDLIAKVKVIAGVLVNDLMGAWKSITGQTDKAGKSAASIGDIFKKVVSIVGGLLATALKVVGGYFTVIGNVIKVVIKVIEVLITIFKMIALVIAGIVVKAFDLFKTAVKWVLDHLGPVGTLFKTVAKKIGDAFSNIGPIVSNAMNAVVGFIQDAINSAIDLVNDLIDKFNSLPDWMRLGKTIDVRIEHVAFSAFGGGGGSGETPAEELPTSKTPKKPVELDGTTATGGTASKALDALTKLLDDVKSKLVDAASSYKEIYAVTQQKFGEPSSLMKAFGATGDIGSAISMYDQLDASLATYYNSLINVAGAKTKQGKILAARMKDEREALKTNVAEQVRLFRVRADIDTQMKKLDEDYAQSQTDINAKYDELEQLAASATKAIEEHYAQLIPKLESSLKAASAAYDKENAVLSSLKSERDSFLNALASGLNSFVNNMSADQGSTFVDSLKNRVRAVKDFTTQIKDLLARGLDSGLVQQFVASGVGGAGETVAALVSSSDEDLKAINDLQADLAAQTAEFTATASQQWFDAGIAQQEAIVGPLRAAATAAQTALDLANAGREADLAAARVYAENLKTERDNMLADAKKAYDEQKQVLIDQGIAIDKSLNANADSINDKFLALQKTMPPQMIKIGVSAVHGLIAGMESMRGPLIEKANSLAAAVKNALKDALKIASPSKVTAEIGKHIGAGLVEGMRASESYVSDAASSLALSAVPNAGYVPGAGSQSSVIPAMVNATGSSTVQNVTVNANTNANAMDIAREMAWQLKVGV